MKHLLITLVLVATLATFSIARADSFDSDDATIQKASDKTAKVMVDKGTYKAEVSFADGASWDDVKDHYELSDASLAIVKSGHVKLSVSTDGGATWSK